MRWLCILSVSLFVVPLATAQGAKEPFRAKVVSAQESLFVESFYLSSKKVTPDCQVPWSIRLDRLHGGKQEGSELLSINNGKLTIVLIPTRGLGILSVTMGDLRLGWDSPVKEVVHPKFINLQARSGLGWLEGFNEWLARCGLENNGQAGKDEFINNMGDKATMDLTLHGKIANIPASEVEIVVERTPPFRIHVKGLVQERMLFGPKLDLRTTLTTEPGSNSFRIHDEITNGGAQPEECQMLYHFNFGTPLLEEGARFLAPAERVTPFNAQAAKDAQDYNLFRGPTPGYIEQVYLFKPLADKKGRTTVLLHNKDRSRGASLSYGLKELPYLTLWKNTGAQADGYVCGIEPGTNYPNNRRVERKFGRVVKLGPGKTYPMTLDVALHASAGEVSAVAEQIAAIQGKQKLTVDQQPGVKE